MPTPPKHSSSSSSFLVMEPKPKCYRPLSFPSKHILKWIRKAHASFTKEHLHKQSTVYKDQEEALHSALVELLSDAHHSNALALYGTRKIPKSHYAASPLRQDITSYLLDHSMTSCLKPSSRKSLHQRPSTYKMDAETYESLFDVAARDLSCLLGSDAPLVQFTARISSQEPYLVMAKELFEKLEKKSRQELDQQEEWIKSHFTEKLKLSCRLNEKKPSKRLPLQQRHLYAVNKEKYLQKLDQELEILELELAIIGFLKNEQ